MTGFWTSTSSNPNKFSYLLLDIVFCTTLSFCPSSLRTVKSLFSTLTLISFFKPCTAILLSNPDVKFHDNSTFLVSLKYRKENVCNAMDMRRMRLCILKEYVKRNEINVFFFSQSIFLRKIVLSLFSQIFFFFFLNKYLSMFCNVYKEKWCWLFFYSRFKGFHMYNR